MDHKIGTTQKVEASSPEDFDLRSLFAEILEPPAARTVVVGPSGTASLIAGQPIGVFFNYGGS